MNRRLSRWLLALYPRAWRDRYGAEVGNLTDELIDSGETTPLRAGFDLTFSAVSERGRALSRPRKVLVTAMAFATLLVLGFALTGHQQAGGSQTSYTAVGAGCRVNLPVHGKAFQKSVGHLREQFWQQNFAGKPPHVATVVIVGPKCGMPGLVCDSITLAPPQPKPVASALPKNFRKVRAAPGKGWTVDVHVKPPTPVRSCSVRKPATVRVYAPKPASQSK